MRAKEELPECPVATAVSLIGGKWKLLILRNLMLSSKLNTASSVTLKQVFYSA